MKNELHKQNTGYLVDKGCDERSGLYQIVLHNDDFTPMEFVLGMLEKYMFMDRRQAVAVMLEAHQQGRAVCGFFTKEVAESKLELITDSACENEHPLVCSMEAA